MAKAIRTRKVFIDWSQNADFKMTVGVYSLRAKRGRPYVSAPVTWNELREALDRREPRLLDFEAQAALQRFHTVGDLFADVLTVKQKLPPEFVSRISGAAPDVTHERAPKALQEYEAKHDFRKPKNQPLCRRAAGRVEGAGL